MKGKLLILGAAFATTLALLVSLISRPETATARVQEITVQIGSVYTCTNAQRFRVESCDASDWCRVFKFRKPPETGGFTVPYTRNVLTSDIKSFHCVAAGNEDVNSSNDSFSIPIDARSIDLFKPTLGNFRLLNSSNRVQLPSLLVKLPILEQARDSAEGLYRLPSGQEIKVVALAYPTSDASFSMADKIELEMRRQSYAVTMLRRKSNKAFLVDVGSGKSFVTWTNGFRAFFSFGIGANARMFFDAGIY